MLRINSACRGSAAAAPCSGGELTPTRLPVTKLRYLNHQRIHSTNLRAPKSAPATAAVNRFATREIEKTKTAGRPAATSRAIVCSETKCVRRKRDEEHHQGRLRVLGHRRARGGDPHQRRAHGAGGAGQQDDGRGAGEVALRAARRRGGH